MPRNFRELEAKMPPRRLARAKARARQAMGEMLLAELRKDAGLTQASVADALGIKQPTLSRLEAQDDMQISTLRRLVKALGGELELVVTLPGRAIVLTQFAHPPRPRRRLA